MDSKKAKTELVALIVSARNQDQAAFETLLEKYSPLIESCVTFYSAGPLESHRDDFNQEATIAFYNSICTYDVSQDSVEFGLYAKICISNALNSQIRLSKKFLSEPLEDNVESLKIFNDSEDPSLKILEKERMDDLLNTIRESLSDYEYKIWKLYFSGFSPADIAPKLNTDAKSVSNAIYRIRVKLRSSIKND